MRSADKHLTPQELESLLFGAADSSGSDAGEASVLETREHLSGCVVCQAKAEKYRKADVALKTLAAESESASKPPTPGAGCPGEQIWPQLAVGLIQEDKAEQYMGHAAQCDWCRPLLKESMEDLTQDVTVEEQNALAKLPSAASGWQGEMGRELARVARASIKKKEEKGFKKDRAGFDLWIRWAWAPASLAVLALVAWFTWLAIDGPDVNQLLAQAYTERRTLDLRISGATYAPIRIQRGDTTSSFEKPAPLLKAESVIAQHLRTNPNNPVWMQAKARADLLDGNYDSAINSLERASDAQPESPSILTDLGTVYSARAKSDNRPIDDGRAIEFLTQALAKSPDNPIALFNRGLVFEHLSLYTDAVEDWEHYLRLDPQGGWADEVRQRLEAVKRKIRERKESLFEPLLTPQDIAKRTRDLSLQNKIDARVEDYLRIALSDWAVQAFPDKSRNSSVEARSALSILAEVVRDKHGDWWLIDFLHGPTSAQFGRAVKELAKSLQANERGDYVAERNSAHEAARRFRLAGSIAGELRADAEEVYSDHLLFEAHHCMSLLQSFTNAIRRRRYRWIEAQMSLEKSNCSNAAGDLGTYRAAIDKGLVVAERYKYPSLRLRAIGFEVLSYASVGECGKAFLFASQGLTLFWAGQADLMKGYNLYFNLESAAETLRLSSLQVALLNEATILIDVHPNPLIRAMAHTWYGKAAYLANLPQLASAQFKKASELLKLAPQTTATQKDEMDAEIYRANAEIRQGDLEQAAQRLKNIRPVLETEASFDPLIGFYSAQADIALLRANPSNPEPSLRSAVYIAETALNSYRSERERRQWAEQTRNTYLDAVEWKLRQDDGIAALELWEWYRGADLRSNKGFPSHTTSLHPNDAPPLPTPTAVATRLPFLRNQTVIAFAAFDDGIAVWAYDDRGVTWRWVHEPLSRLQQLAVRFQRLCADSNSDIALLRAYGRTLYDLLIAPVDKRFVSGRTVMLEPDDVLVGIPWEALVDPKSHYFAERGPIVLSPSVYRVMSLRETTRMNPRMRALIVSVPTVPGEDLPPLFDVDDEVRSVAVAFGPLRQLKGDDATLKVIRHEIHDADVFHFIGHAVASPQRSGLVLAEQDPGSGRRRLIEAGSFSPAEISSLKLAVLSACNSGGEMDFDSGTDELAGALLRSGVPHVVGSRWSVDSRATAEFMKGFYTNLLETGDVANAIYVARIGLARQPAWSHPYYWAAFELRGN